MYVKELIMQSSTVILSTIFEGQRRNELHLIGLENSETPEASSVWPSDHRDDYRYLTWSFNSLVQIIP